MDEAALHHIAAQRAWSIEVDRLIAETATSWVYRVHKDDGFAVLKILKPYGADEIGGANLMQWCGGDGMAIIHDIKDHMILMEWLGGASLGDMSRSGQDDQATTILCDVAAAMHRPRSAPPPKLTLLAQQCEPLTGNAPDCWPSAQLDVFKYVSRLAKALLANSPPPQPLHGDLHHDNIMHSPRGWLAIDPKGLWGDPAYEFSNVFRNPVGAKALATDPVRLVRVAEIIASRTALPKNRILGWAAVHSTLSVTWNASANRPVDDDFVMLPLLLNAYESDTITTKP